MAVSLRTQTVIHLMSESEAEMALFYTNTKT